MSAEVPTIETARLRLRAHRAADFEASLAMWTDPGVYRYIGGEPSTPQRAWARILAYAGHWKLLGFGYWAVERIDTGAFVGELGFADYKRGLSPAYAGVPELGWALVPDAHGRGFATEALRAAAAWGDERFEDVRTICLIDVENVASLRVAAKLGFTEIERMPNQRSETLVFGRPRGAIAP